MQKKGNNSVEKKPSRRGTEDCQNCARELLHLELGRQCGSVRPDCRMRELELLHPELRRQCGSVRLDCRIRELELLHPELRRQHQREA
jgi:hypothetical protein